MTDQLYKAVPGSTNGELVPLPSSDEESEVEGTPGCMNEGQVCVLSWSLWLLLNMTL